MFVFRSISFIKSMCVLYLHSFAFLRVADTLPQPHTHIIQVEQSRREPTLSFLSHLSFGILVLIVMCYWCVFIQFTYHDRCNQFMEYCFQIYVYTLSRINASLSCTRKKKRPLRKKPFSGRRKVNALNAECAARECENFKIIRDKLVLFENNRRKKSVTY